MGKYKGIQFKDNTGTTIYPNPFPIGSLYMSIVNINPSLMFGGTWEQIKDKFILAAGNIYKNGTSGGNATHSHTTEDCTLNINQIPSHNHNAWTTTGGEHEHTLWFGGWGNNGSGGQASVANSRWGQDKAGQSNGSHGHGIEIGYSGGSQPHNHGNTANSSNMPPYLAVYVWIRIK